MNELNWEVKERPFMGERKKFSLILQFTVMLLALVFLNGCSLPFMSTGTELTEPDIIEKAQIIFLLNLYQPLEEGEQLEFVVVDEVTGVPYNQERIEMSQVDAYTYGARYQARVGTVVTYRYEKITGEGRSVELNPQGEGVEYRVFRVSGPENTIDMISGWQAEEEMRPANAYITGQVVRKDTGIPLSDIFVYCAGIRARTDGNGNFTIYPVPEGEHVLTALSMDGTYLPFQQRAITSASDSTPVEIPLLAAAWKQVTFHVTVPEGTVDGAPVRVAGNLAQFGNVFTNLGGGVSVDVNQMPKLTKTASGDYTLKISLPAETDIRYKYTLGDGFWNAEHDEDQSFEVRQLIIPDTTGNVEIKDDIFSWHSSDTQAIWFRVNVPAYTPDNESIGVQFKLADWMPSLPMYYLQGQDWAYPLISPHNFSGEISYRYCRNGMCSGEYQPGTEFTEAIRRTATHFTQPEVISDQVESWSLYQDGLTPDNSLVGEARGEDFSGGIIFSPFYTPAWHAGVLSSIGNVKDYSNLVIMSPGWQVEAPAVPELIHAEEGNTPSLKETASELQAAHDAGVQVGIFPQLLYFQGVGDWWQNAPVDEEAWWKNWLDQYQAFIFQYAELAAQNDVDVFVIGGDGVLPAMPLDDHIEQYQLPGSIESIWGDVFDGIESRYDGQIALQIPISSITTIPASMLGRIDLLYVQWDAALDPTDSEHNMTEQAGDLIDTLLEPFHENLEIPVVLVLAYPSAAGYDAGCVQSTKGDEGCVDVALLMDGAYTHTFAEEDLAGQAAFYEAVLGAVNDRAWVNGVLSMGYYPPVAAQDATVSIHGKPAEILLEDWLAGALGK